MEAESCYQAVLTHDARFDGAFYVGVTTTGIYCRTICPARTPRRDRCRFFANAATAEKLGFRPCLRCRPELAPGHARVDAVGRLAAAVASRIEDGALADLGIEGLATQLGVSSRHLRRAVETAYGVSVVALAQTHRLLLAKRLLTDTRLPIIDVAFSSGFASLRRFNALFRSRYGMAPGHFRRGNAGEPKPVLECRLAYRDPFDWASLLRYLATRAPAGSEGVQPDGSYARTVDLQGATGWIRVLPDARPRLLRLELSASLAPCFSAVISRTKRLFDLNADPLAIAARLGDLAAANPGLRVPGAFDGFEVAVRAILGQQITVRGATAQTAKFVRAFGAPAQTPFAGLDRFFPRPGIVAAMDPADIAATGIIKARTVAIVALAGALARGEIRLGADAPAGQTIEALQRLPGVGPWTAQYIAMRCLAWPDAFPHGDLGIAKALGEKSAARVLSRAEEWRPWRAYAAMHLWKRLEPKQ